MYLVDRCVYVCVSPDLIRTFTVSVCSPIIHQVRLVDDAYDQLMLDGAPGNGPVTGQEAVTQLGHRHSRTSPCQRTRTLFVFYH